jgi:ureidoacrylate peracid hydrolase
MQRWKGDPAGTNQPVLSGGMMPEFLHPIHPSECCLLVIDVQNDFCHPSGYSSLRDGDDSGMAEVATQISRLSLTLQERGIDVRYFKMEVLQSQLEERRRIHGAELRSPCVEGTWGAEIFGLPHAGLVYTKHTTDCFKCRAFDEERKQTPRWRTMVLCGFQTPLCIESSARSAYDFGYRVILLNDLVGCRKRWSTLAPQTIEFVRNFAGEVVTVKAFLQSLSAEQEAGHPVSRR